MTGLSNPTILEELQSQLPALRLLRNLGWKYLSPADALAYRGGKTSNVLLEGVLVEWLRKNNAFRFKGVEHPFTETNILSAVQDLKEVLIDGLVRTNEKIYDLLTLGKSLQQSIEGHVKSSTLQYINWKQWDQNVFHVAEEYEVERSGSHQHRRPDIVLFVNGIPFAVIECKSQAAATEKAPIAQAISQQIRNQKEGEIPALFIYSQLLLALAVDEAKFGTTGTPEKFWAIWREEGEDVDKRVQEAIDRPLSADLVQTLLTQPHRRKYVSEAHRAALTGERLVTEQDRLVYALCSPERLLEMTYRFTLYDGGVKKVARYQQYFAVKAIMRRVRQKDDDGARRGGVVWHTQGSGKSLTMVMLAKSIALDPEIVNYKIVLVTDRVDLDDQIYRTFLSCGREVEKAGTGKQLAVMLDGNAERIITTVIDKFEAATGRHGVRNEDPDIFVLVDEGHRTQFGSRHAQMRKVLPNAAYVGFTGTPVMKKNKDTVQKFGGIIGTPYTIDKAVQDKAVVPLLYEGRHVDQRVDAIGIDAWFDRVTEGLSREQAADLKRKFSTTEQLNKAEQKVKAVAWDISAHFRDNFQGTDAKVQLVAPDKATALLYKHYLDEFGIVSSEVLISGPDEREGEEDIYKENKEAVQRFWRGMMERFGSEKNYNTQLINWFKNAEDPEIIIVVSKLITGFDAPRNTILYLCRKLEDHTLLQAIARVNRLHPGKDFGYIIDYRGVLGELDQALDLYSQLPETLAKFDAQEVAGALTDISVEIESLPQKHSILWDTFKQVRNRNDVEEYERLLGDPELRVKFYDRLSAYSRTLGIALASYHFLEDTPAEKIDTYKKDLKFFAKLRTSVRHRYAEAVDFGEYEPRIKKLLDTHVSAGEVETITPLVDIFDQDTFKQEVDKLTDPAAKADTIAHRTAKTIHDRMDEDRAFYRRFSDLLQAAIAEFREQRISANEYLKRVKEIMQHVLNRTGDDMPKALDGHDVAKAYYGTVTSMIHGDGKVAAGEETAFAELALAIEQVIDSHRIVNWINNTDVQNQMRTDVEDQLFDFKEKSGKDIDLDTMDEILEEVLVVARTRRP